jgi:hypothetical protein
VPPQRDLDDPMLLFLTVEIGIKALDEWARGFRELLCVRWCTSSRETRRTHGPLRRRSKRTAMAELRGKPRRQEANEYSIK